MDREPERITVDHILIAVANPRMPAVRRTEAEAEALAAKILDELRHGGDWNALKSRHSDDRQGPRGPAGGPYSMVNAGVAPKGSAEFPRAGMVPAFGNVGFALAAGEVGIAHFHAKDSPYGVHLILRMR
jgi:hypothetical protein